VIEETDRVFDGYQLASAPDLKIMRIDRYGKPGDALINAVRGMSLPDAATYAWGGGDTRTMQTIGRILRRERRI